MGIVHSFPWRSVIRRILNNLCAVVNGKLHGKIFVGEDAEGATRMGLFPNGVRVTLVVG